MNEKFKLKIQDPEQMYKDELINKLNAVETVVELGEIASNNTEVASLYYKCRFEHLKKAIANFTDDYSGYNERGYLLDQEGTSTDTNITQIDDFGTDESFLNDVKLQITAKLAGSQE